jgi:hypothetical protein
LHRLFTRIGEVFVVKQRDHTAFCPVIETRQRNSPEAAKAAAHILFANPGTKIGKRRGKMARIACSLLHCCNTSRAICRDSRSEADDCL